MYFRLTAVLLLLVGLACRGQAQEVDAKKLCDLIRTPSGSMMFGIGFNTKRGFVLAGESVDNSAEIAAIEKSLRGDATDAERYYQLSQLYEDTEKGKHAAAEAAKLFRKNLEQDPRDGRMALRLGQCLLHGDNEDEAEKMFRRSVALAPGDAECWCGLGDYLWTKSFWAILKGPDGKNASQLAALMGILTKAIPPENLRASQKYAGEARDCMNRAVAAAPRHSRYYMARAFAGALDVLLEEGVRVPAVEDGDLTDSMARVIQRMTVAKVFADIQKAAELEPTNPRALVVAEVCEMAPEIGVLLKKAKMGDAAAKDRAVEDFGRSAMQKAKALLVKLEPLTEHREKRIAAEACLFQGLILVIQEKVTNGGKVDQAVVSRAERLLRRSVALEPGNPSAWDMLMVVLMFRDKNWEELTTICEARIRTKDNAMNRFLLAKILVQRDRYAEAEKHLRAGLAIDAKSTINHVALAAVLLRSGKPAWRAEAMEHLDKAEKLLQQSSDNALTEDVAVLRAVHAALTGRPADARRMLNAVLARNRTHEMAEEMLKVLAD